MYLKHIICQVKPTNKAAFSSAQEQWSVLKEINGFRAQFGGWIADEAHIFALWNSKPDYELFMKQQHPQLTELLNQDQCYDAINIEFYEWHTEAHPSNSNPHTLFQDVNSIQDFFNSLKNDRNIHLMGYHQQMIYVKEWNIS